MKTLKLRKNDLIIILPIVICLVVYGLILAVMYRHLPERLPNSMDGDTVTEWINKSHLFKEIWVRIVALGVCALVMYGLTKLFHWDKKVSDAEEVPTLPRFFTWFGYIGVPLACLTFFFDGLKRIFYGHFLLLEDIAEWLLFAFGVVFVVLIITTIIYCIKRYIRKK